MSSGPGSVVSRSFTISHKRSFLACSPALRLPRTKSTSFSAKPGFVDRLIQRACVTNGGRMATFETASARLSAVVVLGR